MSALPRLKSLLDAVVDHSGSIKLEADNRRQKLLAVALHATVLEHSKAIIALLESQKGSAAAIILRSSLEAYADLRNLAKDSGYVEQMHAAFLGQQQRTLKLSLGRSADNPYFQILVSNGEAKAHLTAVTEELRRLERRGIRPMNVFQRFDRAGMQELYDGPYSLFCSQSHNNLAALEDRHVDLRDDKFQVVYFKEVSDEEAVRIMDTTGEVAVGSYSTVCKTVGADSIGQDIIAAKFEDLRSLWRNVEPCAQIDGKPALDLER